jgi:hypothetical protein
LNPAAAMASIFSVRVPLRQTVAMAVRMLVDPFSLGCRGLCRSGPILLL